MTTREKITGTKNVAERMVAADEAFVATIAEIGSISRDAAARVVAVYWKLKVIKRSGVDRVVAKHGGFMEREVILRALAEAA